MTVGLTGERLRLHCGHRAVQSARIAPPCFPLRLRPRGTNGRHWRLACARLLRQWVAERDAYIACLVKCVQCWLDSNRDTRC